MERGYDLSVHLLGNSMTTDGPDYKPLIDYMAWRVLLMNTPDLLPERINRMRNTWRRMSFCAAGGTLHPVPG
jgi:hypothetical protein